MTHLRIVGDAVLSLSFEIPIQFSHQRRGEGRGLFHTPCTPHENGFLEFHTYPISPTTCSCQVRLPFKPSHLCAFPPNPLFLIPIPCNFLPPSVPPMGIVSQCLKKGGWQGAISYPLQPPRKWISGFPYLPDLAHFPLIPNTIIVQSFAHRCLGAVVPS